MNLTIRGLDADLGPYHADTFTNDLHPTLKADFILANPPFNYNPWNQEKLKDDVDGSMVCRQQEMPTMHGYSI